jgi:hypothetical protein
MKRKDGAKMSMRDMSNNTEKMEFKDKKLEIYK